MTHETNHALDTAIREYETACQRVREAKAAIATALGKDGAPTATVQATDTTPIARIKVSAPKPRNGKRAPMGSVKAKVMGALNGLWLTSGKVAERAGLPRVTVHKYLSALAKSGAIRSMARPGKHRGNQKLYRRAS